MKGMSAVFDKTLSRRVIDKTSVLGKWPFEQLSLMYISHYM
jgi:hypothetical protein